MSKALDLNRRHFIKLLSVIPFFNLMGCSSPEPQHKPRSNGKMGVALVGLGQYSSNILAPALQETKNCYLAGIVTGTPEKARAWKKKYQIPDKSIYNYKNFDDIINNPDIDIVYVVLPNSMHAEYTIRAAKAGKHVICEKPMATSISDAEKMIRACKENNVQLAIGYRLHYEPFNLKSMELGQKEVFGKIKSLTALNGQDMTNSSPDVWRLDKERSGGGPLMDMGIYCVQGTNYTIGKNPVAVTARFGEINKPSYFYDVEESISWQMEYDNGVIAQCNTTYSGEENLLEAKAETGWWRLSPAYAYDGKKGETSQGKIDLPNVFEQALQMDAQADNFRKGEISKTSGEMGLQDMKILMAIYESARNGGKRVKI